MLAEAKKLGGTATKSAASFKAVFKKLKNLKLMDRFYQGLADAQKLVWSDIFQNLS